MSLPGKAKEQGCNYSHPHSWKIMLNNELLLHNMPFYLRRYCSCCFHWLNNLTTGFLSDFCSKKATLFSFCGRIPTNCWNNYYWYYNWNCPKWKFLLFIINESLLAQRFFQSQKNRKSRKFKRKNVISSAIYLNSVSVREPGFISIPSEKSYPNPTW